MSDRRPPAAAPPSPAVILAAMAALYGIWGSTYLAVRIALEGFPPFVVVALRLLLAGVPFYAFLRWRGVPAPSRKEWAHSAIMGALLLGMGTGGVTFAERYVSSSIAAVMVGSMPLYAAFFAGLFGQWPRRWEWLGLAVGAVGVVLLNLDGELRASVPGAVALVLSPLCWGLGSVLSRRLTLPRGPMASAAQLLTGGALLSVAAAFELPQVHAPGLRPLLAVLFLSGFGSIVGYSCYQFLLRTVRPTLATSYAYVNPVVAVALGLTLGGETLTRLGALGAALVVVAVIVVALGGARRTRRHATAGETSPPLIGRAAEAEGRLP